MLVVYNNLESNSIRNAINTYIGFEAPMLSIDAPIVTPQHVIAKRGIQEFESPTDTAILCFRGRKVAIPLIHAFDGALYTVQALGRYRPIYYSSSHDLFIVTGALGVGPVTASVIEELYSLGIRTCIGYGAAGSINPHVQPGDAFIAQNVLCTDGTSREYTTATSCEPDTHLLQRYVTQCTNLAVTPLTGLTTDALYRETLRKIAVWRQLGADFINMEVAPFHVVCNTLGIAAIYVGLITDALGEAWNSTYWNTENTIDRNIIQSLTQFCSTTE